MANEEGAEDEDDSSTPSLDNHVHDKGAAAATILEETEVKEIYMMMRRRRMRIKMMIKLIRKMMIWMMPILMLTQLTNNREYLRDLRRKKTPTPLIISGDYVENQEVPIEQPDWKTKAK